ncbi:hypothetical protein RRG08_055861 [Elysia crispata]|uniref:Uncharacterized protein n=1 Tax=Elysia crispata TaxID=231223 RepID=A0AAE0ZY74_9GAST|nr:hypothetical protein RRG08_055861 [Elysia crispata]
MVAGRCIRPIDYRPFPVAAWSGSSDFKAMGLIWSSSQEKKVDLLPHDSCHLPPVRVTPCPLKVGGYPENVTLHPPEVCRAPS